MEQTNIEQLKKLAKVFNTDNVITSKEIEQVLQGIMSIMASFRKENIELTEENKQVCADLMNQIETSFNDSMSKMSKEHSSMKEDISSELSKMKVQFEKDFKDVQLLVSELQAIELHDGENGLDGERGNKIFNIKSFNDAPSDVLPGDIIVVDDTNEMFIYE